MSLITRFNGAFKAFASEATGTFRTVFGGTTQSNDLTDNLTSNFKKGWEIVGTNDEPTIEDFNAMGYTLSQVLAYIHQVGIVEWSGIDRVVGGQDYYAGKSFVGYGGDIYVALLNSGGSIEARIPTNTTYWKNITVSDATAVKLTGNQTIDGIKTFSSNIVGNITGNAATATTATNQSGGSINATTGMFSSDVIASQSITIGTGGNFSAGSIYSNSSWGMIFRAKQLSPATAQFMWANSEGAELFRFNGTALTTNITGNSGTSTALVGDETSWASYRSRSVANMLGWEAFGNGHCIFDASAGTTPNGVAVNNTNPQIAWYPTHPTLMGWNGGTTYGVRVDSARVADSATYALSFETAVGSAPSYACRAWVNFNGTGTVAIRASGNVSSITDNGVGDYTVNFTTAMTDVDFSVAGSSDGVTLTQGTILNSKILSSSSFTMEVRNYNGTRIDTPYIYVSIFR